MLIWLTVTIGGLDYFCVCVFSVPLYCVGQFSYLKIIKSFHPSVQPADLIACETACKQCDKVVMAEGLFIS